MKIYILSLGCVRPRVIKDGERVHYLPLLKSKGALNLSKWTFELTISLKTNSLGALRTADYSTPE